MAKRWRMIRLTVETADALSEMRGRLQAAWFRGQLVNLDFDVDRGVSYECVVSHLLRQYEGKKARSKKARSKKKKGTAG